MKNLTLPTLSPTPTDASARLRAMTFVASPEAADRLAAELHTRFFEAWQARDTEAMSAIVAAAAGFDAAHPDEPRLVDELDAFNTPAAVA
ncbi:hypothetical protein [Streptomyces sp. CBMA152]|uniref:hypothetical protein n=1 Tax=Streptomyces sp. CBMA152 TaxID=1896312 RepID=UPI001660083B|nr:hypothetical protein [Streptomyces sp. CBMA152]MBD0743551.1 hypothetical protein [Streptomyces sp. CBMA152]